MQIIIMHSFLGSGRQLCKRVIFIFIGLDKLLKQILSPWFCDSSSIVFYFIFPFWFFWDNIWWKLKLSEYVASFIFFSLWPVGFGTFVSNKLAMKPQEQSNCEVFCVIKVGVGNRTTVSKIFLGKHKRFNKLFQFTKLDAIISMFLSGQNFWRLVLYGKNISTSIK